MFFFFFSSRRRHTRCSRDWSSDVCSSDLDGYLCHLQEPFGDVLIHGDGGPEDACADKRHARQFERSEEHTSELQSRLHLVCRLLLEKKNNRLPSSWPTYWWSCNR